MAKAERRERRRGIKARRERVTQLRKELRKVRTRRTRLLERVQTQCDRGRTRVQARIDAVRALYNRALKQRVAQLRARARARCKDRRTRAATAYQTETGKRKAEIRAKEQEAAELRAANEADLTPAERKRRARALELAQERESFILQDIPPDLHPVWRQVRKQIRSNPKASRAEQFFRWVEEHPDEVVAILDARANRQFQHMLAKHEAEEKALYEEQRRALRKAGYSDREARQVIELAPTGTGGDVPF